MNNRLCDSCYRSAFSPCSECGVLTATITTLGKPTKNTTCVSCTTRMKSDTRCIGKKCVICGKRFSSMKEESVRRVCDNCICVKVSCPQCGKDMPKYKEKGGERKFCSMSCIATSVPKEKRSVASKKANKVKWKDHVYKSHQNKIARCKSEYNEWRKKVYERDNYTCQKCGERSGNGHSVVLHPHHIKPFATHAELRYELSNGITLCESCHKKEHKHVFIGRKKKTNPNDAFSCTSGSM